MNTEIKQRVKKLCQSKNLGLAYIFPNESVYWSERFTFELSPENIANIFMSNSDSANRVLVTDLMDRFVCDSMCGGFLNRCPDQNLCGKIVEFLTPIQLGEVEPKEILSATDEELNMYMSDEEQDNSVNIKMM